MREAKREATTAKESSHEAKKAQTQAGKQRKKGAHTDQVKMRAVSKRESKEEDDFVAESKLSSTQESDNVCPACGGTEEDTDSDWILACNTCSQWYHIACTGIPQNIHDDSLDSLN